MKPILSFFISFISLTCLLSPSYAFQDEEDKGPPKLKRLSSTEKTLAQGCEKFEKNHPPQIDENPSFLKNFRVNFGVYWSLSQGEALREITRKHLKEKKEDVINTYLEELSNQTEDFLKLYEKASEVNQCLLEKNALNIKIKAETLFGTQKIFVRASKLKFSRPAQESFGENRKKREEGAVWQEACSALLREFVCSKSGNLAQCLKTCEKMMGLASLVIDAHLKEDDFGQAWFECAFQRYIEIRYTSFYNEILRSTQNIFSKTETLSSTQHLFSKMGLATACSLFEEQAKKAGYSLCPTHF